MSDRLISSDWRGGFDRIFATCGTQRMQISLLATVDMDEIASELSDVDDLIPPQVGSQSLFKN